jgi:hypothetical protein
MPDIGELYLERVAIMEVEGKIPTGKARWKAYQELRRIHGYSKIPYWIHKMARDSTSKLWDGK